MNKNFYKTIFSKARGEMIAVAENVSASGQSAAKTASQAQEKLGAAAEKQLSIKVLSFSMMLVSGAAVLAGPFSMSHANVAADPNAAANQRPTVMNSANGTTQVNIQTPSQSGVSMNQYKQFDVNQQGVILNNSRQNTSTQLGGYIQGNPWLAGGEAKVIVNQVNSSQASNLNGYIEVGGKKADVIIANTAGIQVDGGGFINAGGVTLTTGKPVWDQGNLNGFQIRDGLISITGKGLDTSSSDYTQLLSQAAQINAGVWAKDLRAVTGQNDIDSAGNVSAVQNTLNKDQPKFAIDTGSLGGMYAGKISLVSTEKGIGINNAGQIFASAGQIKISADGLLQNSGSIVAQHKEDPAQSAADIQAKALNNSGSISSLANQSIRTDEITNNGLITASGELNIRNSGELSNASELNAGRLDITAQTLNNKSGKIVQTGLQDLAVSAGTLRNSSKALIGYTEAETVAGEGGASAGGSQTGGSNDQPPTTAAGGGGTSSANTPLSASYAQGVIQAENISNDAKITANGGVDLNVSKSLDSAGTLNLKKASAQGSLFQNTGILSAQTLQANASEFKNMQGQIYTGAAEIKAGKLSNQQGLIQAKDGILIQAQQDLNNRSGRIAAQKSVDIHDGGQNTLSVDNSEAGKILSEGDIRIQSRALTHSGQSELAANNDIKLQQQDQFTSDAAVQAGRQLDIENASGLINNSLLEAGSALNMDAAEIQNNQNSVIQANNQVSLSAQKQIKNTGTVNSSGLTLIKAGDEIQNIGTGQIYGDHIALQTGRLLNAEQQTAEGLKAGTIAARKRLDIAAQRIENREQALLSSENQLAVGGQLNQDHLAEGSAQSLDNASARIQSAGDMKLSADMLSNRNLHFSSSVKEVPNSRERVIAYQPDKSSEIFDSTHYTGSGSKGSIYLDGKKYEDYTKYDYQRYEKQDTVDSSAPASIVSGGTLTLDGQNLSNDKSQILAADSIKILQNDVNNIDADGEHRVIQNGTSRYHYVGWNSTKTSHKSKWNSPKPYNPADIVTPVKLNAVKYDGAYKGISNALNPANILSVKTEAVDDKTSTEIRTITPDLSLPNQSLFSINKDNNNKPLIETNSAFTEYRNWLGSDYMLKILNTDPVNLHKRLGDGYYEQKLVNDQVAQLTGRVYLEGYSNYEDQFKALMDAGISAAKDLHLNPGIALSEAQIARLTSDIVWMVTETVTLADGQKVEVLVPKVYALVQQGDLNGQGTLIAANTVSMQLKGDLNSSGTIAGRQLVNLSSSNINNAGGLIQGAEVYAKAEQDINNTGGAMQAEKALLLDAGNHINASSTVIKTQNKHGSSEFSAENIGRKAGLYVTGQDGQLALQAGKDIHLQAAAVNSAGSISVQAGEDISLSAVNVSRKDLSSAGDDDYVMHASSKDQGTQLQAKNDILLRSGRASSIQAGKVSSESGNVVIDAAKGISIREGRQTEEHALRTHESNSSALSKSRKDSLLKESKNLSESSVIAGEKIVLNAGENLNIQGSEIASKALTQLQADGDVNIQAARDFSETSIESRKKKSGLSASFSEGVASAGIGKSKTDMKQNSTEQTLTQSVISSGKGNTVIAAGQDLNAEAALIHSGKDLTLQGQNVHLNAAAASSSQQTQIQSKNSGLSVGLTYNPIDAAVSAYKKNAGSSGFTDSAPGKVMSHAEAVNKAVQAAATPIVVTGGSQKNTQNSSYSTTQAVVTQAEAQGNLNIIAAGGSISSQGAQLSAEGDALLHAKDNIHLSYAADTEAQHASSKHSGFSIDNRDKAAPAGIFNNKNQGSGSISSVIGTQLSAGGKSTLQTAQGDVNIIASSAASEGDVHILAARDVNILSAQNTKSQAESSSNKGIGSAQISDTEQFFGYMKGASQSSSNDIEQQRSQVGSLGGSVNIQAGRNYLQQSSDIVAKQDVNIDAQSIQALENHNRGSASQSSKDVKAGIFKRISSPILDLLGSSDKAAKSKADDRTQALQALAAGAQAYQSYSDVQEGSVIKAEAGLGFSTSKNQQNSSYAQSQQNKITAGRDVNLNSTAGDIHLQNTQVTANDAIQLNSAKDIILESGQSQAKADGKNSNAGLSVGVGASAGAQTGAYIYAEAGYGKGSNRSNSNTHTQTVLNAENISLNSAGDTVLKGAKAEAKRIDANAGGKLSVISLQDSTDQKIKQTNAGGRVQASLGTAWQASGNVSSSKASGSSSSVSDQSGLFAGEGGYHVKADSVDLQGGAIVSTANKENNDLTANSLTFSNLENQSAYNAKSVSLSGGTVLGKADSSTQTPQPTSNTNWRDGTSFSPSLPQSDSEKDSSTTYATLSAGNINIGGKDTTVEALGIHSDAASANRNVDTLPNLQDILDQQKTVADATSTITAAARTYAQDQVKRATAEKEDLKTALNKTLSTEQQAEIKLWDTEKQDAYYSANVTGYAAALANEKAVTKEWGMGGDSSRALNAVTIAITGALGGQTDLQTVSNALAPYAAQKIGSKYGHGEDKNTAAQLASHAILGAALAYVNGGNPAAGGSAAVASEAAATYFTKQLEEKYKDDPKYFANGEFQPNLLSEAEKSQIRDLTAAIGAVVGGTVGDSAFEAQLAGVVGQNAVENNVDSYKDIQNAKAYSEKMYKDTCAAYGLGEPACGNRIRKEGLEILQGTAMIFVPTSVYEIIPIGKGVGIVVKGTKKIVAVYKDAKSAEKAAERAKVKIENNIHRDDDLISRTAAREDGLKKAENISTATASHNVAKGQVNHPRNIQEQMIWNDVLKNPKNGVEMRRLDGDGRFPQDAGFVKMRKSVKTSEGKTIDIHYQYNSVTNKVYDMKVVNKPLNMQ